VTVSDRTMSSNSGVRLRSLRGSSTKHKERPTTIVYRGEHLAVTKNMYEKCVRDMPEVFGFSGRARFAEAAKAKAILASAGSDRNTCLTPQSETVEESNPESDHTAGFETTIDESRQTSEEDSGHHAKSSDELEIGIVSTATRTGRHTVRMSVKSPRIHRGHRSKCQVVLDASSLTELVETLREIFDFTRCRDYLRGVRRSFVAEAPHYPRLKLRRKSATSIDVPEVTIPGRVYNRFERLAASGSYRDACLAVIDAVNNGHTESDIPSRDEVWARLHRTEPSTQAVPSLAYALEDWKHSGGDQAHPSPGFMRNLKAFLASAAMCARMATRECEITRMFPVDKDKVKRDILTNPYVIYAIEHGDERWGPFEGNEVLYVDIYSVQRFVGPVRHGAYEHKLSSFIAEGGYQSADAFEEAAEEINRDAPNWGFKELAQRVVDRFWKVISSLTGLVSSAYGSFLDSVRRMLIKSIMRIFGIHDLPSNMMTDTIKRKMALVFSVSLIFFLMGAYILGNAFGRGIVRALSGMSSLKFEAQAEISPAALVVSTIVAIFGLATKDADALRKRSMYLMSLIAGGTLVANIGACCFSLMPTLVQDALSFKFGTEEYRLKRDVDMWRSTANALIQFSKISKVVVSDYYMERVTETMKAGSDLQSRLYGAKHAGMRTIVVTTFIKLQKLQFHINSYKNSGKKRPEPFVVHIAGPSGIGKTLIADNLAKEACDANTIYTRNANEEHWNGYASHDAVILDEWLVGGADKREREASEFLTLASSSSATLNMATLDDPFVGIKGTKFESDTIFTLNNTLHDRVPDFDAVALQRRRDVVIEVRFAASHQQYISEGKILLATLPREDLLEKKWFECRAVRSIYSADYEATATPWCTYQVMVQNVRAKCMAKRQFQEVMRASDFDIQDDSKTADQLINEELRKTCSLPSQPMGVVEAIAASLGGDFVAEAPTVEIRHVHECECGVKRRHKISEQFCCPECLKISPCEGVSENDNNDRVSHITSLGDCDGARHFHECPWPNCDYKQVCQNQVTLKVNCPVHGENDDEDALPARQNMRPTAYRDYNEWLERVWHVAYHDIASAWDAEAASYAEKAGTSYQDGVKSWFYMGLIVALVVGVSRWFGAKDTPELTFDAESTPKNKTSHRAKKPGKWSRAPRLEAEASRTVETVDLDVGHLTMKAIPICNRWLLTYAHGLFRNGSVIPAGTELSLTYHDHVYTWKLDPDSLFMCHDPDSGVLERDLAFINFQCPKMPQFKNARNLFATEDEIPETRFRVSMKTRSKLVFTEARPEVNVYSYEGMQLQLNDGFMYQAETTAGDCGTPLLLAQGRGITKCVGIHVAGTVAKDYPFGLATRVTREMIEEVLDMAGDDYVAEAPQEFFERLQTMECPNLKKIEVLSKTQRVHMATNTKLKPSAIAEHLPWSVTKEPAIMSKADPRSQGKCPVEEAIATLVSAPKVVISDKVLREASVELKDELKRGLDFSLTGGLRTLTFEEAVFGIPGALSGVDTSTHAGYPYCYFVDKRGKRSLVWHRDGEGFYTPEFQTHCMSQLRRVQSGEDIDKVFIGFMKDETRSKSKIDKVATRITYSNDVSYNVVCRMLFGSLIIAFNHSFPEIGYALGINPTSFDAGKIYHRLRKFHKRLVAGDFGEYDLRHQRQIMDECFGVLEFLGRELPGSSVIFEHARKHDTTSGKFIGDYLIHTLANNDSGGLWTTILNCITADLYLRYAWKTRYPHLRFSDYVRAVILGDDHILAISEKVEWNPLQIRDDLVQLGQLYTSAWKDKELDDKYLRFDQVMFLGSYFVLVDGQWSGALRKETLQESLMWTRNNNLTIYEECKQMVEYASQWDEEYYEWYKDAVNAALGKIGFPELDVAPWASLRKMVAYRTTDSGADFRFVAQSGNLTKIDESTAASEQQSVPMLGRTLQERSLNDSPADLQKGPDSLILRSQLDWSTSSGVGSIIYDKALPFEVLGQGDQQNLQNMTFQNFLYSEPDVEITVQINGSPTAAGMLCLFMVPLINVVPDLNTWPSLTHVMINPNENTTATVVMPFKYWKSLLDNQDAHSKTQAVAWVKLGVYSPLVTKATPSTCGVVIYSRFKTRAFIPRQMAPSATNTRPIYGFTAGTGAKIGNIYTSDTTFLAQGNISSTNVTNTYTMGDVAGSVPSETTMEIGGQATEAKLTVPMDNPPLVGGGVPTVAQFPSMSRSAGVVPTTGLALHPQEMSRQATLTRDPMESNIAALCAREGRVANFSWSTSQADGAGLITLGLGSWVTNNDAPTGFNTGSVVPFNVWMLNEFKFARYDVVFRITAVRTKFHSGRILASVYYGVNAPTNNSTASVYNTVLDFNGDNMVQEVRVPYNNTQEYVRTNDNSAVTSNYRPGYMKLFVMNELRTASEIVATSIDVIVTIKFENVRVAVPTPYNPMSIGSQSRLTFTAQSGTPKGAEIGEEPEEVVTGTQEPPNTPQLPCRVVLGEKFEFNVTDIHELLRRYTPVPSAAYATTWSISDLQSNQLKAWRIPVYLTNAYANVFAAWSGTIKFRIFVYDTVPAMVMHTPVNRTSDGTSYSDVDLSHMLLGAGISQTYSGVQTVTGPYWPTFAAREMTMPLSSNCSWIDVSVPFCSELNFLPNQDRGLSVPQIGPWGNGYLWIKTTQNARLEVFHAAGDDFRYHNFCPAPGIERRLANFNGAVTFPATAKSWAGMFV